MPITPLPQFEADLAEHLKDKADREAYERLNAPKTIVVRFGVMVQVGEFPYRGDAKPGCGSKLVVRTHRGIELAEMLTSTCPNAGCSKSVSRKEMLEYIGNSGGRQYPFFKDGKVLRIASKDDLDRQAKIEQSRHGMKMEARGIVERLGLPIHIVDAEPILGGERVTIYYTTEERIDLQPLTDALTPIIGTRVEMRQVGARDEARVAADYERCGQYCCCKNFLKVLKPVSMRSAKIQKATLDPLKISGRCGRLMCCLRYEDETYDELRKRLPHRKSRVGTPDGDGIVIDSQILTQLVRVRLDSGQDIAVPVEDLTEPGLEQAPPPKPEPEPRVRSGRDRPGRDRPSRGESQPRRPAADEDDAAAPTKKRRKRRRKPGSSPRSDQPSGASGAVPPQQLPTGESPAGDDAAARSGPKKKRSRRRRRGGGGGDSSQNGQGPASPGSDN